MNGKLHFMEGSKVMFSPAELALLSNSEIILTKNRVILQIIELFGEISTQIVPIWQPLEVTAPEVIRAIPKISRGEQYISLPWVMLDYPRCFDINSGHFALRTFCWWGHYFTIQLHLSGIYLKRLLANSNLQIPEVIGGYPLWSGVAEDAWNHQCPQPGLALGNGKQKLHLDRPNGVYKLIVKIPLKDWDQLPSTACSLSNMIIQSYLGA